MKHLIDFRQIAILIIAIGCLASCGGRVSQNRSANLPQNQNTNAVVVEKDSPAPQQQSTPSPEIVIETPGGAETPDIVTVITPSPTLTPEIANAPLPPPPPNADLSNSNLSLVAVEKLIVPVAGVKREQLQDTFKASRSEGRVHDAIDIMAPQGTPVLAVADGEIARFFDSERGGITIYQYSRDKKLIYYYAHLQRRAENLQERQFVRQGTVIGYVGDTGNSGAGNFHLHFAIWAITDPKRYWDGTNINPYSLLR